MGISPPERIEIRATGRVWGDVVTTAFATEDGAFLRGQVRMEEQIDLKLDGVVDLAPSNPTLNSPEDNPKEVL